MLETVNYKKVDPVI